MLTNNVILSHAPIDLTGLQIKGATTIKCIYIVPY